MKKGQTQLKMEGKCYEKYWKELYKEKFGEEFIFNNIE